MTTGQQLVDLAMTQKGDAYIFGVEVAAGWGAWSNAKAWDCSEIVERACGLLGVHVPDGSNNQRLFCKGIPVALALTIPGALLFIGGNATHHVAISRGDGSTIEAKGRKWGVVVQSAKDNRGRFDRAGLIPGIDYSAGNKVAPADQPVANKPPAGSMAELAQVIFYSKQIVLGPGKENPPAAVKLLEAGLNRWFGDFAKLTKSQPPAPLPVDGVWDQGDADWVILLQRITNHNEFGEVHGATWDALYPPPLVGV